MTRYSSKGRKSLALGTIAVASLATAACEPAIQQPLPAPDVPVQFASPSECIDAGYETIACSDAFAAANKQHAAEAPRYTSRQECEQEWGPGNCGGNERGGSSFMPLLTGYLLGSALSGNNGGYYNNGYYGSPIYRSRSGPVQLAPGGSASTTGTGIKKVATAPVTAPKPANVNTRSVSRGGFGGSTARSSGSRSFGG